MSQENIYPTLKLTLEISLSARDLIMNSAHNKKESIDVFCAENDSNSLHMVVERNVCTNMKKLFI